MTTQRRWCNRARTELLPTNGSFQGGDARWCGYVDLAMHIAKNPKGFTDVDKEKALNILSAEGMDKLASHIIAEAEA